MAAALAIGALAIAAPAAAQDLPPDLPPDPPPAPPDCPLDPPEGYVCTPGPSDRFAFVAGNTSAPTDGDTTCNVDLEGATPPNQEGYTTIQWRATAQCDRALRVVTVDTRLLRNGFEGPHGTTGHCHMLAGQPDCGLFPIRSEGEDVWGPAAAFVVVARVRLVLNEPGAGDPWVVTPGASPAGGTSCAPGGPEITCEVELPIASEGIYPEALTVRSPIPGT
jgi:hypothetical protein